MRHTQQQGTEANTGREKPLAFTTPEGFAASAKLLVNYDQGLGLNKPEDVSLRGALRAISGEPGFAECADMICRLRFDYTRQLAQAQSKCEVTDPAPTHPLAPPVAAHVAHHLWRMVARTTVLTRAFLRVHDLNDGVETASVGAITRAAIALRDSKTEPVVRCLVEGEKSSPAHPPCDPITAARRLVERLHAVAHTPLLQTNHR